MKHVLDIDGDWFAMPPYDFSGTDPKMSGPKPRQRLTIPPAVGDVIANTQTDEFYRFDCPYNLRWFPDHPAHEPEGTCSYGCRDEPACVSWDGPHDPRLEPPEVEWADPPFLRVVDVQSIVSDHEAPPQQPGTSAVRLTDTAWLVTPSGPGFRNEVIDLPGAVPGGWAIRVEEADPVEIHGETLAWAATSPPPTTQPLNQETT